MMQQGTDIFVRKSDALLCLVGTTRLFMRVYMADINVGRADMKEIHLPPFLQEIHLSLLPTTQVNCPMDIS